MAEHYEIPGAIGLPPIPVTDFYGEHNPDFNNASYIEFDYPWDSSAQNVKQIWAGNGAYINAVGVSASLAQLRWDEMDGTVNPRQQTPPYFEAFAATATSTKIYLFAVRVGADGGRDDLEVYWNYGVGFRAGNDIWLYKNAWTTAEQSGVLEPARDWDESPSAEADDPFGMMPEGGEFADREAFGLNDDNDLPVLPDEMTFSGFMTVYSLNPNHINALGQSAFSSNTWTNLRNKFNGVGNPIDYIISAVEIPYTPATDNYQNFNIGGVEVEDSQGNPTSCPTLPKRLQPLNFGSIRLKEVWGTAKDYTETQVSIYLPYVGVKDIDASVVMNSTITLKGGLDLITGDVFYALHVSNANAAHKYIKSSGIIYRWTGNAGKQFPIGKVDNSNQILAAFGAMASLGAGVAMGVGGGGIQMMNDIGAREQDSLGIGNAGMLGGGLGLIGAATMAPKASMAGGVSGSVGRFDVQYPYLIIRQNVPQYPDGWRERIGAPRYQTFTVSDLHGFTKFADFHADDIEAANDEEKAMIEQAMKAGVFLP